MVLHRTIHDSQSTLYLYRAHKKGVNNDSIVLDQHLAEHTYKIWLNFKNSYVKDHK